MVRAHLVPTDLKPPSYFRTYEQLKGALTELAAKYPNLVELTDIGDSGDKTRGSLKHLVGEVVR